jgi:hypothetical protein
MEVGAGTSHTATFLRAALLGPVALQAQDDLLEGQHRDGLDSGDARVATEAAGRDGF